MTTQLVNDGIAVLEGWYAKLDVDWWDTAIGACGNAK